MTFGSQPVHRRGRFVAPILASGDHDTSCAGRADGVGYFVMGPMLQRRLIALLQAMAVAWPDSTFAFELHTPGPIPPVDDDDDDDDDDGPGGGSGGGSIDPDDDEGDSDDDDDETLWTRRGRRSPDPGRVQ
jgi:hypothetical protein